MPVYLARRAAPLPTDELAAELVAARTATAWWTKGEWPGSLLECTEREAARIARMEDVISARPAPGLASAADPPDTSP